MTTRYYSSSAQPTTLSGACTDVSSTIQVSGTAGFPAAPYILAVDYGTAQQELVLVTGVAGNTLTVTRGFDSSSAAPHSVGAPVRHVHSAIDFRDSRTHENSTTGVHGVSGSVVGTTDAQALSNKDLTAGTNTFPASLATAANLNVHTTATAAHGVTGAVVGTTDAQTLTNKTLTAPKVDALKDTSGNTVLGLTPVASAVNWVTVANSSAGGGLAVSASGADANINLNLIPKGTGTLRQNGVDVATVSGTQTVTNKTLSTGTRVGAATTDISGAWTAYTPTPTNFVVGNGTLTGRYMQIGKTVQVRINFVSGTTSSYTGGDAKVSLPVAAHGTGIQTLDAFMNGNVAGVGAIDPADAGGGGGTAGVTPRFSSSTTNPLLAGVQSGTFNPGAGTGGYFVIEGTYEVA